MCGIAGIVDFNDVIDPMLISSVTNVVRHRGPDGEGYFLASFNGDRFIKYDSEDDLRNLEEIKPQVAFGHRRLAIIDLTGLASQPMISDNKSFAITYNGEIYNYIEIREELKKEGVFFKTQSDTEVILKSYEKWGEGCVTRFNGMWGFAIWDRINGKIFCSRDRGGVKPFYYFFDGSVFLFCSEIKGILKYPSFRRLPNRRAIYDYLVSGITDHSERTFFERVNQLGGGYNLTLDLKTRKLNIDKYWDINPDNQFKGTFSEAGETLYHLFEDSVRLRLRSDVPVGTCLSGGLDSSSILSVVNRLMLNGGIPKEIIGKSQKTFSSCFSERKYDERNFIEIAISKTGASPAYVFPDPETFLNEADDLVYHQDEPFGSTSIYAQWCVMRLASENKIKVLLDGQGADELFSGYNTYYPYFLASVARKNGLLRCWKELLYYKKRHSPDLLKFIYFLIFPLMPQNIRTTLAGKALKRDDILSKRFADEFEGSDEGLKRIKDPFWDNLYYMFKSLSLPALLRFEDRNSMAFSIESRVPFLDYRLIEFVFSLPSFFKIDKGVSKVILRESMKGVLPEEIRVRMDKMGFVTPQELWFKNELKPFVKEVVTSKEIGIRGFLNGKKVLETFNRQSANDRNNSFLLWRIVNLELWLRKFIDRGLEA